VVPKNKAPGLVTWIPVTYARVVGELVFIHIISAGCSSSASLLNFVHVEEKISNIVANLA
jgi:hypothetical protein